MESPDRFYRKKVAQPLPAAAGDDRLETLFLSRLPMWMMGTCIEGTPFQSLKGECMRLAAVSTGPN